MPNIANIVDLFERFDVAPINVNPKQCVVVRNRNVSCRKCALACTSEAIFIENNRLNIEASQCIGCGTCSAVCPTAVFVPEKPNDLELYRDCLQSLEANEGRVIIACDSLLEAAKGLFDPERVAAVKCIGRVEESLLARLALQGAFEIILVKAKCEECSHVNGVSVAEMIVGTAEVLFSTWGIDCDVRIVSKLPSFVRKSDGSTFDDRKRSFFSDLRGEAKSAAITTAEYAIEETLGKDKSRDKALVKVNEEGVLPQFEPWHRHDLLECLDACGQPEELVLDTHLWGSIDIDFDKCQSCRICATFCPTGALKRFDEETEDGEKVFGLDHSPRLCVQCGTCSDVCLRDALSLYSEVEALDIYTGDAYRFEMEEKKHPSLIKQIRR